MLANRRFALLDPASWKDKNDSRFLEAYRVHSELAKVYASCLTYAPETYHHWEVFSRHNEGVCVEFREIDFLDMLPNITEYRYGDVKYYSGAEIKRMSFIRSEDLPFMKGDGYEPEKEFRVIFGDRIENGNVHYIRLNIDAVNRIIINPWIPHSLIEVVRSALKGACGGSSRKISASRLLDDQQWRDAIKAVNNFEISLF